MFWSFRRNFFLSQKLQEALQILQFSFFEGKSVYDVSIEDTSYTDFCFVKKGVVFMNKQKAKQIPYFERRIKKMLGRRFMKGQQRVAAFVMALFMVITSVGIIPIKADAAGRKIVKKLSVAQASLELEEGESENVKYKVTATKGASKKIMIKVSDKKVISAKVSGKKIVVKAKKEGKSTITVMTKAKNKKGKRITKKIRVVVENEEDDAEEEYDFEDCETDEEDEIVEKVDDNAATEEIIVTEATATTEKTVAVVTPSAGEKTTETAVDTEAPAATEKTTEKAAATEAPATTEKTIEKAETVPSVSYQAHIQDTGWMSNVKDGETAGKTGKGKQLEALKITLNSPDGKNMISYRAHVAYVGWQNWVNSGQIAGTTSQTKAIEAVQINLCGTYAQKYDIYYRVCVAYKGWLGWAKNGETAGSTGIGLRTEAIQIKLVKKGTQVKTELSPSLKKPALSYKAHVEDIGWQTIVNEEAAAGTTGKSLRMEALQINLKNFDGGNGIFYRAHVSNVGWQGWKASGEITGTTGQKKAIEAMEIKLDDSLSNYFDIYYRMHVADIGWLGWAKNGETAGTTGGGVKAEAIQLKLMPKDAVVDRNGVAYLELSLRNKVVDLAKKQVGYNAGNNKYNEYGKYFGKNYSDWCGYFVAWCMNHAGVPSSIYNYNGSIGRADFPNVIRSGKLHYRNTNYDPKPGDTIYFDWSNRNPKKPNVDYIQHVELVVDYDKNTGKVTTVGGNKGGGNGKVAYGSYSRWDNRIIAFGEIDYSGGSSPITEHYTGTYPR